MLERKVELIYHVNVEAIADKCIIYSESSRI